MKVNEIDYRTDYWLLAVKQMKEHGVITTQQKSGLVRKIKAWNYDRHDEKSTGEGIGDE